MRILGIDPGLNVTGIGVVEVIDGLSIHGSVTTEVVGHRAP